MASSRTNACGRDCRAVWWPTWSRPRDWNQAAACRGDVSARVDESAIVRARVRPVDDASEDFELLKAWSQGDREAGAILFERHVDVVRRFFANKVSDPTDLVQSSFLSCFERPEQFQGRSSFRSYLLSIARFKLYHHYRGRSPQHARIHLNTSAPIRSHDPSPSAVIGFADDERILLQALRMIPLELQVVLELVYWEELSGQELSEVLEIPLNTVYGRVHRAKQKLRDALSLLLPGTT